MRGEVAFKFCSLGSPEQLRNIWMAPSPTSSSSRATYGSQFDVRIQCRSYTRKKLRYEKLWDWWLNLKYFRFFPSEKSWFELQLVEIPFILSSFLSSQVVDFPKYISEIQKQKWCLGICEKVWHKYEKKYCSFIYKERWATLYSSVCGFPTDLDLNCWLELTQNVQNSLLQLCRRL